MVGVLSLQEVKTLVVLAGPICCNSVLTSLVNVITLAYAGRLGTTALAAIALSLSTAFSLCRLPLTGLAGALDTQASQVENILAHQS